MLWLFMYIETQNFNYSWKKKKDWFDKFWKKQKTMIVKIHMYVFFLNEKEVRSKQVIINQNW